MAFSSRSLGLLVSSLLLGPGCRCSAGPPEPAPAPAPSASANAEPACPPPPAWAPPALDSDLLIAEVIYPREGDAGSIGTAMRIFSDGRATAYDDVNYIVKNGKLVPERRPGMWRPTGPVSAARIDELRTLIATQRRQELTRWQGRDRKSTTLPSLVTLRVEDGPGGLVRSCYRDGTGSPALQKIEPLIRTIIGEAGDAADVLAPSKPAASR